MIQIISDYATYPTLLVIACSSSLMLVAYFILNLVGIDLDFTDGETFFSVPSVLTFFNTTSWVLLALLIDFKFGIVDASMIAIVIGLSVTFVFVWLWNQFRTSINKNPVENKVTALVKKDDIAIAYFNFVNNKGMIICNTIHGTRQLAAFSTNGIEITAFDQVRVIEVLSDNSVHVERYR